MTESEQETLAEARVFALASPILIPILARRRKDALGRLIQKYKSGESNTLTLVAELSVLNDIETEINQKEATYRHLEEKQHARNNRK